MANILYVFYFGLQFIFAYSLAQQEEVFHLTYNRESIPHFPKPGSRIKIYNGDPRSLSCHLQIFCPFSSCLRARISGKSDHLGEFYDAAGQSDTFIRYNVSRLYFESPSEGQCALHYNCHKSTFNQRGDATSHQLNPYWRDKSPLRFQKLREFPPQSCQTAGNGNCVGGVYKVETNSMMYFHTSNCFPGLSANGRNLNPYEENKEYYCPTVLHGQTLYRSMPKFWSSLAKCTDPNPDCYSDYPLEVTDGLSLKEPCLTKNGQPCFDKPWMDQNGFWRLGCTFISRYGGYMCATAVGNTGLVLVLDECRMDNESCLNENHQLVPKGFMDKEWMSKPWYRVFPQLENSTNNKEFV